MRDTRTRTLLDHTFQSEEVLDVLRKYNDIISVIESIENESELTKGKILDNCKKLKDFTWVIDYIYKLAVMFDDEDDREVIIEMDNN